MNTFDVIDDFDITMPPDTCAYLPLETASLRYRVFRELDGRSCEQLFRRGWRRHGRYFFRPECPACVKCRSLRVDVQQFRATKSQRRTIRRNTDVRMIVQRPTVSDEEQPVWARA